MSEETMDVSDGNSSGQESAENSKRQVYLPNQALEDGEELTCDLSSAYVMHHELQTNYPCLSFDILPDNLGDNRETFPMSAYLVGGTQPPSGQACNIIVMKLSNMSKVQAEDDEDEDLSTEDEDDDELDEEEVVNPNNPKLLAVQIKQRGCVNRLRNTVLNEKVLTATWSDLGRVNIWDITPQLQAVESVDTLAQYKKNYKGKSVPFLFSFNGHQTDGFAIDWCPTMPGVLATGDNYREIHIWQPSEGGTWQVDQRPLIGHKASVEDIQWSPNERHVMASCSVDKSIRIWDTRASPDKACKIVCEQAHANDVNCISWNKNEPFIVSGCDDGLLRLWDLRMFQSNRAVATFKHHTDAITSVEWHPSDSTVFASSGADDQLTLWDLSVERDTTEDPNDVMEVPPQLLFIHQGQRNIKELHWHKQLPGVVISTAETGFNIFRTISV